MYLEELAVKQEQWLMSVGWDENSPLTSLALIASEVGKAMNECRGEKPTAAFGSELADIVLIVIGLAKSQGLQMDGFEIKSNGEYHQSQVWLDVENLIWLKSIGWHNKTVLESLGIVVSIIGKAIIASMSEHGTNELCERLKEIVICVDALARQENLNLLEAIHSKMALNLISGNKSRLV